MASAQLKALLGMDTAEFQKKMDGATAKTKDFQGQMGSVGKSIAQAFSVVAIANFAKTMADQVGILKDTADNLTITTDSLQALNFVSKQNGVETNQMVTVLGKLKKAQGEVVALNKPMTEALTTLGIKAEDFVGLSVDVAVERLGQAYTQANGSAEAFEAVATLIGDKAGPRLMSTLEQIGKVGLKSITDNAKEAGQVLGQELIERADTAADQLTIMWDRVKNGGLIAIDYLRQGFDDLFMLIGIGWAKASENLGQFIAAVKAGDVKGAIGVLKSAGKGIGSELQAQKNQRVEEQRLASEEAKKKETDKKAAQSKSDTEALQRNIKKAKDEELRKEQEKADKEQARLDEKEYDKINQKIEESDKKEEKRRENFAKAEQEKADILTDSEKEKADILNPERKLNGVASGAINADALQRMGGQVGSAAINLGPQEKALRIQEELKNLTKETNKKLADIAKEIGGLQP